MEPDTTIPGVTFHVVSSQLLTSAIFAEFVTGRIELTAEVTDNEIWNDVKTRLDGLRIYAVENLAEEMISVVQERAKIRSKELEDAWENSKKRCIQLEQELSFTRAELQQKNDLIRNMAQTAGYVPFERNP